MKGLPVFGRDSGLRAATSPSRAKPPPAKTKKVGKELMAADLRAPKEPLTFEAHAQLKLLPPVIDDVVAVALPKLYTSISRSWRCQQVSQVPRGV